MQRTEDRYSMTQILLQGNRGWNNLNTIAQVMVENHATSEKGALSLSKIARLANMDLAHLSRLVSGKAGFVRVVEMHKGPKPYQISKGMYYLVDPCYILAATEGHYYPRKLQAIAEKAGINGLLSTIVYTIEHDGLIKKGEAKSDPYISTLVALAGHTPTSVLTIPVLMDSVTEPVAAMIEPFLDMVPSLLHEYVTIGPLNGAQESDLKELEKETARIAWKAAVMYFTVREALSAREVR